MAKVLFISNIGKRVGSFSVASIAAAKKCGLFFYYAANWKAATNEQRDEDEKKYGVKLVHIDLERSPYSSNNIKAYKQLVDFVKKERIDYIHCNTPVGGILGRIVGEKCKVKKVIYQVHGFHFYDGAPIKNWLIYYPIERWLAKKTDAIITINKEDYERAKKFKLRNNGKVYYVPGVGMDLTQYNLPDDTREKKRKELGVNSSDIVLISMGDLIERKNYPVAIEAFAKVNNSKLQYFICGQGPEEKRLIKIAKDLEVEKQIHFLGYRVDIKELLCAADIFLFTSKQEGLARSLMEAMARGLPCVASRIRGNIDLLEETRGGILCDSTVEYVDAINEYINCIQRNDKIGESNKDRIKDFELGLVISELKKIYVKELLNE